MVPSGWGLLSIAAPTTLPCSKYTVPWFWRSSEVTRRIPVFWLRSSSWKTSWIPSSLSGPSMAMAQPACGVKM